MLIFKRAIKTVNHLTFEIQGGTYLKKYLISI